MLRKNKVTVFDGHGKLAGAGKLAVTKDGKPVAALVDARLFERIRRMQGRFDQLCQRMEAGFSQVGEEAGMAEIDAAVAEERRSFHGTRASR